MSNSNDLIIPFWMCHAGMRRHQSLIVLWDFEFPIRKQRTFAAIWLAKNTNRSSTARLQIFQIDLYTFDSVRKLEKCMGPTLVSDTLIWKFLLNLSCHPTLKVKKSEIIYYSHDIWMSSIHTQLFQIVLLLADKIYPIYTRWRTLKVGTHKSVWTP